MIFKKKIYTMKAMKKNSDHQKELVHKRIEKLDPNNNKNLPKKPLVKHGEELIHDDGFEHRKSAETANKV